MQLASPERVKKLAGNGRQDQGVFADVVAPRMRPLDAALDDTTLRSVLVLDGLTTPANVGMILRTATAAGLDGIVVPRRGVASIDPLVVKASAGVAFRAPILKAFTAGEAVAALKERGFHVVGLDADGDDDLFTAHLPEPVGLRARQRDGGALARRRGPRRHVGVDPDGRRRRVAQRRGGGGRRVLRARAPRPRLTASAGRSEDRHDPVASCWSGVATARPHLAVRGPVSQARRPQHPIVGERAHDRHGGRSHAARASRCALVSFAACTPAARKSTMSLPRTRAASVSTSQACRASTPAGSSVAAHEHDVAARVGRSVTPARRPPPRGGAAAPGCARRPARRSRTPR